MVGSQKLEAISLGVTPATERMAASIEESKARMEGGKIGPELGDASQVADPGGNALADEGKSRPTG